LILAGLLLAAAVLPARQSAPGDAPPPGATRQKAIAGLQARASRTSPGSREAVRIAAELELIASAYMAEGETGRAAELLSEAYALDEENGLVLAELTLCDLRAEDFDAARFNLRLAEERVTRAPPEVYRVLGDVYLRLHRLEDAVAAWGEFVRFGGTDPELLARLARARDELAVSRGQRSLAFEHFTVFADAGVGDDVLRRAGADLEAALAQQTAIFGGRLDARQVVVLYAGRAYFSVVSVPEWSSGLYDGKIRLSVEPDGGWPSGRSSVLAHELAHALLRRRVGDRVPAWFHEGLAQWCEGRRLPVREVREAVGSRPAASAEALGRAFAGRLSRPAARASYAQALSLVEYLIASRGTGAIACLLERLGAEGGTFGEALGAEAGMTEGELFAKWGKWAGVS